MAAHARAERRRTCRQLTAAAAGLGPPPAQLLQLLPRRSAECGRDRSRTGIRRIFRIHRPERGVMVPCRAVVDDVGDRAMP